MVSVYKRSSTGILQVIGGVGGFTNVMTKIFSIFGTYFSAKFVNEALAKDLYLKKDKKVSNFTTSSEVNYLPS